MNYQVLEFLKGLLKVDECICKYNGTETNERSILRKMCEEALKSEEKRLQGFEK